MGEETTEPMDKLRSEAARRGGSWNIPRADQVFGWLSRWDWMASLFVLVSVGIAAQTIIDTTIIPEPGKISVLWLVPVFLGTIGLNSAKEYYERKRERDQETRNATTEAQNVALQAEVDSLIEQLNKR